MLPIINHYLRDAFSLLYPDLCAACGRQLYKGENTFCLRCLYLFPYTDYHRQWDNPVERIFWGRCPILAATSLLFFAKTTRVQQALHQLKYNGRQDVGRYFGGLLADAIRDEKRFADLGAIVPVPLHPARLRQRGYNQSLCLAEGIATALAIPCCADVLQRTQATSTQTKKNRYERFLNVEEAISLQDAAPVYEKRILLVDDVLTTGSTLEACANALKDAVSGVCIATIAYAR